jgi:hypothetical protein
MASSATVTAKVGAGVTATSVVISNVKSFSFDCLGNSCTIFTTDGKQQTFAGYSTITVTVAGTTSGAAYTLTLA